MTAMKGQLVDRYLKDNVCPNGLYVIAWFMCDQWDAKDYRKKDTPEMTVREAQTHFARQAVELSDRSLKIRAFVMNAALS
jgi:hypothetical protein